MKKKRLALLSVFMVAALMLSSALFINKIADKAVQAADPDVTVKFDLNGGSGTFNDLGVMFGEIHTGVFPTAIPTKAGYTFTGWLSKESFDEDGDGEQDYLWIKAEDIPTYAGGFVLDSAWADGRSVINLEAQWKAKTIHISFVDADGVSPIAGFNAFDITFDELVFADSVSGGKFPSAWPTAPANMQFDGWWAADYAIWLGTNTTSVEEGKEGILVTDGYAITGDNDPGLYNEYNLVFQATYETLEYTINYVNNAPSIPQTDSKVKTYGAGTIAKPTGAGHTAFTLTGHTFLGWVTDPNWNYTQSHASVIPDSSAADLATVWSADLAANGITLYAAWNPIAYTVTYNNNIDAATTGAAFTQNRTFGEAGKVLGIADVNLSVLDGYKFMGWTTTYGSDRLDYELSEDGDIVYADGPRKGEEATYDLTTENGATINLYAVSVGRMYTIMFDPNTAGGGSGTTTTATRRFGATTPIKSFADLGFTAPVGKVFDQWKVAEGVTFNDKFAGNLLTPTVDGLEVTLVATYKEVIYDIAFQHGLNGTGTMSNLVGVKYGETKTIPSSFTPNAGYNFIGWKLNNTGDLIAFNNVKNLTTVSGKVGANAVVLTAQWEAKKFYTAFSDGGNTNIGNLADNREYQYDKQVNTGSGLNDYPDQVPTLTGHTFTGYEGTLKYSSVAAGWEDYATMTQCATIEIFFDDLAQVWKMTISNGLIGYWTGNLGVTPSFTFDSWTDPLFGGSVALAYYLEFVPTFEVDVYDVVFRVNGVEVTDAAFNFEVEYGQAFGYNPTTGTNAFPIESDISSMLPAGAQFRFWYISPANNVEITVASIVPADADGTIYIDARYSDVTYYITYYYTDADGNIKSVPTVPVDVDNPEEDPLNPRSDYYSTKILDELHSKGETFKLYSEAKLYSLGVVAPHGYMFGGLYENSDFSGSAVTTIAPGETGDKFFYVRWVQDENHFILNFSDDVAYIYWDKDGQVYTSTSLLLENSVFDNGFDVANYTAVVKGYVWDGKWFFQGSDEGVNAAIKLFLEGKVGAERTVTLDVNALTNLDRKTVSAVFQNLDGTVLDDETVVDVEFGDSILAGATDNAEDMLTRPEGKFFIGWKVVKIEVTVDGETVTVPQSMIDEKAGAWNLILEGHNALLLINAFDFYDEATAYVVYLQPVWEDKAVVVTFIDDLGPIASTAMSFNAVTVFEDLQYALTADGSKVDWTAFEALLVKDGYAFGGWEFIELPPVGTDMYGIRLLYADGEWSLQKGLYDQTEMEMVYGAPEAIGESFTIKGSVDVFNDMPGYEKSYEFIARAIWNNNLYSLIFKGTGASGVGSAAVMEGKTAQDEVTISGYDYQGNDVLKTLPSNLFLKEGYDLTAWIDADGNRFVIGTDDADDVYEANDYNGATLTPEWTIKTGYTEIRYYVFGGTIYGWAPDTLENGYFVVAAELGTPTAFALTDDIVKEGYKFRGWSLNRNVLNMVTTLQIQPSDNWEVFAFYTESIKVTFDLGDNVTYTGGDDFDFSTVKYFDFGVAYAAGVLPNGAVEKDGYAFRGWVSDKEYSYTYNGKTLTSKLTIYHCNADVPAGYEDLSVTIEEMIAGATFTIPMAWEGDDFTLNLVPLFEAKQVTITFLDEDGVAIADFGGTFIATDVITSTIVPANPTAATGKYFVGWKATFTDAEGDERIMWLYADAAFKPADSTAPVIADLNSTLPGYTFDVSELEFEAVFADKLSLTFMDGVNELEELATTFVPGEAVTLTTPTKTGYTFLAWENEDGEVVTSFTGGSEDATLYATWEVKEYTVTFNKNAADATGTIDDITADYNTAITLPVGTALSRPGYTFKGWATTADGTVIASYTVGASNATLYAVWEINGYIVSFNANGGTGTVASIPKNYNETATLPANAYTRTGYTFKGWSTTSAGAVEKAVGATITVTDNVTYYAVWEADAPTEYTLTFKNGKDTVITKKFTNGGTVDLSTVTAPTKDGYKFMGWSKTEDGDVITSFTGTAADATLYAIWEKEGMSGGVIALIVVGSVLVLAGAGFCIWWFLLRKKKTA